MEVDLTTTGEKAAVGTGALTALAAFLPWVNAGIVSVSGINGDGVLTLLFAIAAIAVVLLRDWEKIDRIAVGVLGILTILIAGVTFGNLGDQSGMMSAAAGIGLYLTVIGGIGMAVSAVLDNVLD